MSQGVPHAARSVPIAYAGLAIGLALFTALVAYQGVREVTRTLASAGTGLLWVTAFHLAPILASALGWHAVLAGRTRTPLRAFAWARWIAESINQLLPTFQLGGSLVRAQLVARRGLPGPLAGASVVVDITLHLFAQMLFTVLGLCLLLTRVGSHRFDGALVAGLVVTAAMVGAFYVTQRRGVFGALASLLERRLSSSDWSALSSGAHAMDAWVRLLYQNPRAVGLSALWHFLSWLLGAGEVWFVLRLLGHPVDLTTAVVIESVGEAIRTAAFAIPGALGMQEGGLLLVGGQFGLAPEVSVALSLAKRVRELSLGVPGLIAWQVHRSSAALEARPDRLHGQAG